MKKKLLFALTLALLATLVVTTPAFAYTGVTGTVIDSLTLQPWTYGGDVWVVNNTTGLVVATCQLNTTTGAIEDAGGASCDYGDDVLSVGVGPSPTAGDAIEVVIDFNCTTSTGGPCPGGGPPSGTPGFSSTPYTASPLIPLPRALGYIKTGTGPNAVTLADVNTKSPNVWLPVALGVVALVGAGGVVLLLRRRRVA